jgi:hypothetical protein
MIRFDYSIVCQLLFRGAAAFFSIAIISSCSATPLVTGMSKRQRRLNHRPRVIWFPERTRLQHVHYTCARWLPHVINVEVTRYVACFVGMTGQTGSGFGYKPHTLWFIRFINFWVQWLYNQPSLNGVIKYISTMNITHVFSVLNLTNPLSPIWAHKAQHNV